MVERLILPNRPSAAQLLVDDVGRGSLDGIENFREKPDSWFFLVDQRGQDQVNMIRHDDRSVYVISEAVVVEGNLRG